MNAKTTPIKFATGHNLDQAKAFFAASGVGSSTVPASSESTKQLSRVWKKVAEWDASHRVPKRGDGQRINPPLLVDWSPNGEKLATACDAFGITRWYPDGRRIGGGTSPYAYGHPTRFFWSPDSDLVLLEAMTAQNNWWSVQDGDGEVIRQAVANRLHWGSDLLNQYGLHRTRCFNPWRPGSRQLLIGRYDGPRLDLIDVLALPEPNTTDLPLFIAHAAAFIRFVAESLSGSGNKPEDLEAASVVGSVSFTSLGAQDQRIKHFAWHPSGKYVAVTTGHPDDKGMRRVHVLDFEAAEIVASLPPTTSAIGWSPGGRLLFCQQWTGGYTSDWKIETHVWDSHAWALRDLSEEERRQSWARHFEFSGLGVTDDALNADGTLRAQVGSRVVISSNDEGNDETNIPLEGKVAHAAWSPTDPRRLATVGGEDARHSLRIWQLMDV